MRPIGVILFLVCTLLNFGQSDSLVSEKYKQVDLQKWQDSIASIYTVTVESLPLENRYHYKDPNSKKTDLIWTTKPDTLGLDTMPKYGHNSFRGQFIISPNLENLIFKTFYFDKEGATGKDYAIFRSFDQENLIITLRHFTSGPKKMSGHLTFASPEGYTVNLPFEFEYFCRKEFERD
jgi:hypothetical protein